MGKITSMDTVVKKSQHPKDPDYFKKYYQINNKGVAMSCPQCHRNTSKANLSKHMKRNICFKVSAADAIIRASEQPCIEIPDTADQKNDERP